MGTLLAEQACRCGSGGTSRTWIKISYIKLKMGFEPPNQVSNRKNMDDTARTGVAVKSFCNSIICLLIEHFNYSFQRYRCFKNGLLFWNETGYREM